MVGAAPHTAHPEYGLWDTQRKQWVPETEIKGGKRVPIKGSKLRTTCYSKACIAAERLTVGLGWAVFVREVSA